MKKEKQLTAVEFYAEGLENLQYNPLEKNGYDNAKQRLLEKAKEIEKEQHDKTAEEWWKEGAHYMESRGIAKWESFEQYYNETFK